MLFKVMAALMLVIFAFIILQYWLATIYPTRFVSEK
jgi:hypothetical protein